MLYRWVYIRPLPLPPYTRDNNRSNQRETTREDSKSSRVSRARAFPPSPRNLILSNVIPETRLGAAVQSICIRALESLDSDFQLASRERRTRARGKVSGTRNGKRWKGGGMRCPFSRGEHPVQVSSPRIVVPAIIYFLSDRGDRLYGGCSVQALSGQRRMCTG